MTASSQTVAGLEYIQNFPVCVMSKMHPAFGQYPGARPTKRKHTQTKTTLSKSILETLCELVLAEASCRLVKDNSTRYLSFNKTKLKTHPRALDVRSKDVMEAPAGVLKARIIALPPSSAIPFTAKSTATSDGNSPPAREYEPGAERVGKQFRTATR